MRKEIKLKSLKLSYFRGIQRKEINFHNHHTNIFGKNEAGKTTLVDAWNWLLFGKDSSGNTKFEIKTLDKNNEYLSGVEHEVSGVLEVNGDEISIRRVLKEDWTRPKGQKEKILKGHITDYYWNDAPLETAREYNNRIQNILDENSFFLPTKSLPPYFAKILYIFFVSSISSFPKVNGMPFLYASLK